MSVQIHYFSHFHLVFLTHQIFEGTRKVVCIFCTSVSFWFYEVSLCSFKKPLWFLSPGQFEPASTVLRAARTLFLMAAFGSRQDAIVSEMRNGDLMNKGREKRGRDWIFGFLHLNPIRLCVFISNSFQNTVSVFLQDTMTEMTLCFACTDYFSK